MVTDSLDPAGIYFGTRSGKLYASRDAGQTWKELFNGLPQIVCVVSAVIGELAGRPAPRPAKKRKQVTPKKTRGSAKARRSKKTGAHPMAKKRPR
jgi:hypothetical protein